MTLRFNAEPSVLDYLFLTDPPRRLFNAAPAALTARWSENGAGRWL